jgi:hypothetical protein
MMSVGKRIMIGLGPQSTVHGGYISLGQAKLHFGTHGIVKKPICISPWVRRGGIQSWSMLTMRASKIQPCIVGWHRYLHILVSTRQPCCVNLIVEASQRHSKGMVQKIFGYVQARS